MVWLYRLQDRESMPNWHTINHPRTLHTHNETQWPTATCRWHIALQDVSHRQNCHLLTPSHPWVPPVWPYCRHLDISNIINQNLNRNFKSLAVAYLCPQWLRSTQGQLAAGRRALDSSVLWRDQRCCPYRCYSNAYRTHYASKSQRRRQWQRPRQRWATVVSNS